LATPAIVAEGERTLMHLRYEVGQAESRNELIPCVSQSNKWFALPINNHKAKFDFDEFTFFIIANFW